MSPSRGQPLRLESRHGRIPAIDAAGFLIGAVLLTAARLVPQIISPLAFWLLLALLAAAFGTDLIVWLRRGVHAIELGGNTLTLMRGHQRTVQRIERASVRGVRSRRSWGGQAVEIVLRRDHVVLRDDAFDRDAFRTLADRLGGWTTGKE